MINYNSVLINRMNFLDKLFNNIVLYVNDISLSLSNSLMVGWSNYSARKCSVKKRERNYLKLINNIDKLNKLENKKCDTVTFTLNFNDYKEFMNMEERRYYKKFINELNKLTSISNMLSKIIESFDELLNEYNRSIKLYQKEKNIVLPKANKNVKKEALIVKPKLKETYRSINVSKGSKGELYCHFKYDGDIKIIDNDSFNNEVSNFNYCLKNNYDSVYDISDSNLLSSYEKKRRIYIDSMYKLNKNINILMNKDITITYPIDKLYLYSKSIVDIIYKELIDFKEHNGLYDKLTLLTINAYGSKMLISKYKLLYKDFINKLSNVDNFIFDDLVNSTNDIKHSGSYVEYRGITSLIPDIKDLYRIVNKRIIKSTRNYIDDYLKNINVNVSKVSKYMGNNELVLFYNELKNALIDNSLHYVNRMNSLMINLQKVFCKLISKKLNISEEIVVKDYLKEEKLW